MISWKSVGIGIVIGSVLTAGIFFGISCAFPHSFRGNPSPDHFVKVLTRKLKLSDSQRQTVAQILEKRRAEMKQLHDEIHPKFEVLRKTTSEEIRAVLNDEQKHKFQEIENKMKRHMERMRPPPRF